MNIFDLTDISLQEEDTLILTKTDRVRIERVVSSGQTTDWLVQKEWEFVVLLEGNAKIEFFNRETRNLEKGDTLIINPGEKHRVSYTSKDPLCLWLCVFY